MTYEDNTLIHYGVKGQRWGVRKYQNEDGTLTQLGKEHYSVGSGGNKKFDAKYRDEVQKYQKLSDRADIETQQNRLKESKAIAKRGLAVGLPAAAATAGFVVRGSKMASDYSDRSSKLFRELVANDSNAKRFQSLLDRVEGTEAVAENLGVKMPDYASFDSIKKQLSDLADRTTTPKWFKERQVEINDSEYARDKAINTFAILVTGATATAGLGAAAYGGISAAAAKHRLSDKGHAKAVARRDAQYNKIRNMVKDTPYMALFQAQIDAYKKEHPNTELSDKQIMKNLM